MNPLPGTNNSWPPPPRISDRTRLAHFIHAKREALYFRYIPVLAVAINLANPIWRKKAPPQATMKRLGMRFGAQFTINYLWAALIGTPFVIWSSVDMTRARLEDAWMLEAIDEEWKAKARAKEEAKARVKG